MTFRSAGMCFAVGHLLLLGGCQVRDHDILWSTDRVAQPTYPSAVADLLPRLVSVTALRGLAGYAGVKPVVGSGHLGNVIVASQAMPDGVSIPLQSEIIYWRSVDHGATWSEPQPLTGQPSRGYSLHADPWLETDRRGRFYLLYARISRYGSKASDFTPVIRRTRDGGKSWSPPIAVGKAGADRPVLGVSPDGSHLVVASAAGKPVSGQSFEHATGVFVSTDYGGHWERHADPIPGCHAIPYSAVVDNAGRIATAWIVRGDGSRSVVCMTIDQGTTWSETTLAAKLQPDRPHPFNGGRFAVLGVDGQSALHVAFVKAGGRVLVVRKTTDWQKWNEPHRLSSENADECRFTAIDAWGPRIHVAWMERDGGSEYGNCWNTHYSVSGDHGETWSPPLRLVGHPASADFAVLPDEQICIAEDGYGQVHVVWAIRDGQILHAGLQIPSVASRRSRELPVPKVESGADSR